MKKHTEEEIENLEVEFLKSEIDELHKRLDVITILLLVNIFVSFIFQ